MPQEMRRHGRYVVSAAHVVEATLTRAGGTTTDLTGRLLDVSAGGARILVREPLSFNEAVRLRICCQAIDLDLSVLATVCWMRPHTHKGEWVLGCSLSPLLLDECLERSAKKGLFERRASTRTVVDLTAFARWEMTDQPAEVAIINSSQGGLCLRTSHRAQPGDRLRLLLPGGDESCAALEARVQWSTPHDSEYLVGCEFLDARSAAIWQQRMLRPSVENPAWPLRRRGWRVWPCLGAAALLMWAIWQFWWRS
jgi:hypothetical protein